MEPARCLEGGCFCGSIRYDAASTPFHETNCHCAICRRTSGAPYVTWFSVPRARFRLLKGQPARFRSSAKATRSFCPQCGTQLTFEHDDFANEIDITTCSLDDPALLPPREHIYTRSRLEWVELADRLPRYPASREEGL
jgi:hypothetical protein